RATWQGFFIHYAGLHANLVFIMMWGVPMMTESMGLSSAQAGLVHTVNSLAMMVGSPFHGKISSRAGRNRDLAAFFLSLLHLTAGMLFFATPNPRGLAMIIDLVILISSCSSSSKYGFEQ